MNATLEEMIQEVEYELRQRKKVYPRLSAYSPTRAAENALHLARMQAVLATLQRLAAQEAEQQAPTLFPLAQEEGSR